MEWPRAPAWGRGGAQTPSVLPSSPGRAAWVASPPSQGLKRERGVAPRLRGCRDRPPTFTFGIGSQAASPRVALLHLGDEGLELGPVADRVEVAVPAHPGRVLQAGGDGLRQERQRL